MKLKQIALAVTSVFVLASLEANAANYVCSSVGEHLPENRLVIDAKLKTTILGRADSGSYTYKDVDNSEVSGEFTCGKIDKNGVASCELAKPDVNISRIIAHPVFGLTFEITGQKHIVLFSCK